MMEQKSSLDQTSSESFFFFNPRTPCGVRHDSEMTLSYFTLFQSTHSLRSATFGFLWNCNCSTWFQSTHSLRSATNHQRGQPPRNSVSIHALLAECDHKRVHRSLYHLSFNPRTPCGVRPVSNRFNSNPYRFQSTHSLRSATHLRRRSARRTSCFNPRTPCGVRQNP